MTFEYLNENVEAIVIKFFQSEKYSFRDFYKGEIDNPLACFMAALNFTRHNTSSLVKKVFDSFPQLRIKDRPVVEQATSTCISDLEEEHSWFYQGAENPQIEQALSL